MQIGRSTWCAASYEFELLSRPASVKRCDKSVRERPSQGHSIGGAPCEGSFICADGEPFFSRVENVREFASGSTRPRAYSPGYPYPGIWYSGPYLSFGVGFGIGYFGGYGWAWHHWGSDWHRRVVIHDRERYDSRSNTFYDRNNYYRGGDARGGFNGDRGGDRARGNEGNRLPNANAGGGGGAGKQPPPTGSAYCR